MLNLKIERQLRGITLEELSQATRIPVSQLRELEERRFRKPPELVFLKAHLQAYSRYLGLDPEAVLLEYDIFGSPVEPGDEKRKPPGRFRIRPMSFIVFLLCISGLTFLFSGRELFSGPVASRGAMPPQFTGARLSRPKIQEMLDRWSERDISLASQPESALPEIEVTAGEGVVLVAVKSTWLRWRRMESGAEILEFFPAGAWREVSGTEDIRLEIGDPGAVRLFDGERQVDVPSREGSLIIHFHFRKKFSIINEEDVDSGG